MKQILIVDGYNIIGAWPELQKLKDIGLEEARDKLIGMLANYQSYSGRRVIVVFDAYQVPGIGGKYMQHQLEIHFTKEKETADTVIERFVGELSSRRTQVYVATSDFVEQSVTFGQGALRLPARELLHGVRQSEKEMRLRMEEQASGRIRNSFDSKLSGEQRNLLERWRRGDGPR
ncbi:NYN domain-containing protein [Paenibacillus koleovorans]|uniref:NYN domain-containing protein n=1 Tax=Paenibacillus koleovorans TaxID=121608 RepID=UPI000FDC86C8|nr:NYN domain-containing protein [Paenibacillus koleovorans]